MEILTVLLFAGKGQVPGVGKTETGDVEVGTVGHCGVCHRSGVRSCSGMLAMVAGSGGAV